VYVAYLAHIGGKVLIPDAVGIKDSADGTSVDFVDADGRVLATFRRQDLAMHGLEEEMPDDAFSAK
jgi:hypothetical protein